MFYFGRQAHSELAKSYGERAKQLGANAVINIRSKCRNQEFTSGTEYECGAGAATGGVAFIGEGGSLK